MYYYGTEILSQKRQLVEMPGGWLGSARQRREGINIRMKARREFARQADRADTQQGSRQRNSGTDGRAVWGGSGCQGAQGAGPGWKRNTLGASACLQRAREPCKASSPPRRAPRGSVDCRGSADALSLCFTPRSVTAHDNVIHTVVRQANARQHELTVGVDGAHSSNIRSQRRCPEAS